MDIIIYTTPEKLEHKKGADGYERYFWYLSKPPKNFKAGDKIFFAVKGKIVGSFVCEEFNPYDEETIVWHKDSWKELDEPIMCKHFQGFKYYRGLIK
jgi:hypothetical protein